MYAALAVAATRKELAQRKKSKNKAASSIMLVVSASGTAYEVQASYEYAL